MSAAGAVLALALTAPGGETGLALAREVDAALGRARHALLSSREMAAGGSGRGTTGEQALAALAALRAGASAEDTALARTLLRVFAGAEAAVSDDYGGTYHAALFLILLDELGDRASAFAPSGLAGRLARRLVELQDPGGGWGDVSRTEFASMGLYAAERRGLRVPVGVWRRAVGFLRARRLAGGGWGYREGDRATGSMTAAALITFVSAGVGPEDEAVKSGRDWLRTSFRVDVNPGEAQAAGPRPRPGTRHRFYYLAGLAALARLRGAWVEPRWAVEGARKLVAEQLPDGRWKGEPQDRPTEFAALFLVEARRTLFGRSPPAELVIGLYSPGGRELPAGALAAVARSVGRWSDLRAEIRCRRISPARDELGGLALVLVLSGPSASPPAADVAELALFVRRGGAVLIEGEPGSLSAAERAARRKGLLALAGRIALGREGPAPAAEAVRLAGPAPLDPAESPDVFIVRAEAGGPGVLVAPEGLFSLLGAEAEGLQPLPGSRSLMARAAANVFARAVSR